jgi:hypothetical protein
LTDDSVGIRITGYTGAGGDVVILSRIEDMPVLEIGDRAFNPSSSNMTGRNAITSIVIPNGVKSIGTYAFSSLRFTSVVIPDSVEIIWDDAFSSNREITRITLPNNVKVIGDGAFSSNSKLTSINLPASIEWIGDRAFASCGELTDLVIPDSLTRINWGGIMFNAQNNPAYSRVQPQSSLSIIIDEGSMNAFEGSQKLPIRTRQRLQALGYTGNF